MSIESTSPRVHPVRFVVERGVQNATENAANALLGAVNQVMAPCERRYVFESLEFVDALGPYPGSPSMLPSGEFPHEVWLRRGDAIAGGTFGIGSDGSGIARTITPRLYEPSDGWNFVVLRHTILHEWGHANGCSRGDFAYHLFSVEDGTPIPPKFRLDARNPADDYWRAHQDALLDPMAGGVNADEQWSELNSLIWKGDYRMPNRMVPIPLTMRVIIESEWTPHVFVFDCNPFNESVEWKPVTYFHDFAATFTRWPNDAVQSSESATLIKVFAPGHKPKCVWWTHLDDEKCVLEGVAPRISITPDKIIRDVPTPGIRASGSELTIMPTVLGETYLLRAWHPETGHSWQSLVAEGSKITNFIDDPAAYHSVIHLPGLRQDPERESMAPMKRPEPPPSLCEHCARKEL